MNLFAEHNRPPIAWWRAVGLSVAALYIPFVVMGVYTALYVSCSHCKKAVWEIMPLAPGMVPGWLFSMRVAHWTGELSMWITTGVIEILLLAGLSFLMRRGGLWMMAVTIGTLVFASLLAMMTLSIIRA